MLKPAHNRYKYWLWLITIPLVIFVLHTEYARHIALAAKTRLDDLSITSSLPQGSRKGEVGFFGMNDTLSKLIKIPGQPDAKAVQLCVLARTYQSQASYLPIFIGALAHSASNKIKVKILLVDTERRSDKAASEPADWLQQIAAWQSELYGRPNLTEVLEIVVPSSDVPDYGYAHTDLALTIIHRDHRYCDYVLVTNGDNFYTLQGFDLLLPYFKSKQDMIAYGFVSRYPRARADEIGLIPLELDHKHIFDSGPHHPLTPKWEHSLIDLGAAIFRRQFLEIHKLDFSEVKPYVHYSDGLMVMRARGLTDKHVIDRTTLFVHQ